MKTPLVESPETRVESQNAALTAQALDPRPSTLDSQPLRARGIAAPETATGEIMYMPGGLNEIHCGQGDTSVSVQVLVDRGSAVALEAQRAELARKYPHLRAYFDFDHADQKASFWPDSFAWKELPAPGIYATGTWSEEGRAAVKGKSYQAFSPKFHVDGVRKKPARVIHYAEASLNMGGLVNDPAFKKNLPVRAKHAGSTPALPHQTNSTPNASPSNGAAGRAQYHMTPEQVAALQAQNLQLEQEINALVANSTGTAEDAEALVAKRAELASGKQTLELEALKANQRTLEAQLLLQRTKDAEACIARAIKRGAIPVKNEALQAQWKKKCIEDVENIQLLDGVAGSPALQAQAAVQPSRLTIGSVAITRASNENMLKGANELNARQAAGVSLRYQDRQALAREFAALYAREIMPRIKEGDDIPLAGANSLGTLASTLVATRALELLTLDFPLLQAICTDFSDQIVSYGDTLKSRFIGIPAVATFNTSTGWPTDSGVTTTDVSITYNQFKGVPISFLGHEIAGTVRRLFDEIANAQAYALGKNIVDYVYALITAANFTATPIVGSATTFGRPEVIDLGGTLDDNGNPAMGRTCLLNRPYYSLLAKDAAIITMAAYSQNPIITKGVLPDVEGMQVVKAVNLPATVIGAKVLKGFAFTKSALCLASRLSADYVNALPGAGNGNLTVVTTPGGFSANLVQFVSHVAATASQRLEIIYGASAGQPNAGVILTN